MPTSKVTDVPAGTETFGVRVGDWVTYSNLERPADKNTVRIVGGVTVIERGILGSHTPLARALLGAQIGDEVELAVKGHPTRILKVLDIDTDAPGGAPGSEPPTV
jgi:transcription elongation GreA/GreB family factor